VNARAGGTASHTLRTTTLTTAEPTKWFTVASWCKLPRSRLQPQASWSMGLHGETQKSSKSIFNPNVSAARKSFRGGWRFSFTRW
jgi:hypothetical protein